MHSTPLPDSTWTFIDRVDHSQPTTSLTELVAYDLDGNDATSDAVGGEGEEILLIIPQLQRAEMSWTYFLNELSDYMVSHNGRMAALIAGDDASVEAWADISMASYPIYTAEATTLKGARQRQHGSCLPPRRKHSVEAVQWP